MTEWPIEYSPNDFEVDIETPNITQESYQNLGLLFVWWSILEDQVDNIFACFFKLDPTLALNITENMSFRTKIDSINSGVDMLFDVLEPELVQRLKKSLSEAQQYSNNVRNLLAHGRFVPGSDNFHKFSAHGKLKLSIYEIDPENLAQNALAIEELANSIRKLIPPLVSIMKNVSYEDLDKHALIKNLR